MPAPNTLDDLKKKLLRQHVVTESGCWEWTGGFFPNGYGRVGFCGRDWGVHRIAALLWLGLPLNSGWGDIAHKCDNKKCFNPKHLEVASRSKNMLDFNERTSRDDWRLGNKNSSKENRERRTSVSDARKDGVANA